MQETFRCLIEDNDMDLVLEEENYMYALIEKMYGLKEVNIDRQLVRTNRGEGWHHVQRFIFESKVQCFDILRMNQSTFRSLCRNLSEQPKLEGSCHIFLEESVAMFLEMVAQDLIVRVIAERYQHSLDTLKRNLDDVLSALLKLVAYIVKPTRDDLTSVSRFLVDDSRMRFTYAYVGVPGRAHDRKVLTYCATQEASFPHPPPGKYYLVDSGYPNRSSYLGPHCRVRYHLDQFSRGGPPTNNRELFNRKHSGLRSVIEQTFGVWKAKWRIFDRKHPRYELNKWIKIVTATMALHNFIRNSQEDDIDFLHWEVVESYEHHGDENDGHVPYIPAGDRMMEDMRDSITMEMAERTRLPY
ncbi:PREDICTED: uncharacterized protein LOC104768099 [Camelina sativa]|uniref:Uncharacterized protein LOC104768099 n=1 Tax=Camelina sativa TaxID=90675 RepID=A0ABM0XSF0_CAMSA|nr:PREDICTED: uncharacterized protein LOC104768099 [Camelina sativa]